VIGASLANWGQHQRLHGEGGYRSEAGTKQVICGDWVRSEGSLQAWGFAAVAGPLGMLQWFRICPLQPGSLCDPPPLLHFPSQVHSLRQTTARNHLVGVISA